jgi:hypothetical protein
MNTNTFDLSGMYSGSQVAFDVACAVAATVWAIVIGAAFVKMVLNEIADIKEHKREFGDWD